MTKPQENKLTMYEAVAEVLRKHQATVNLVKTFTTAQTDFDVLLEKIRATRRGTKEAAAGKSQSKEQAREMLVLLALKVASALGSFASRTGDQELLALADVKESDFQRARDTGVASIATTIHTRSQEKVDKLADYGVTQAVLDNLSTRIADYMLTISRREAGMAEQVASTAALADLFVQADSFLKTELDRFAQILRDADDAFYREYFAARVIKDLGKRYEPKAPVATQPVSPAVVPVVPPASPPVA
ncbi:MAG: hypothetical protein HY961_04535 [Ignavibacteriae bacterium]|nr:hypothetical protein [Ignavibacteriota bacterium]